MHWSQPIQRFIFRVYQFLMKDMLPAGTARSFSQGGPSALFQVTPCVFFMTPCPFSVYMPFLRKCIVYFDVS
jgi:hypothetical protein